MNVSAEPASIECAAVARKPTIWSHGLLALGDQAIVSGTNFLTTVIIGRAAGRSELGLYSLGFTLFTLILAAQESLISIPYTVFRTGLDDEARESLLCSVFVHQISLAAMMSLFLTLVAKAVQWAPQSSELAAVVRMISVTIIAVMIRDFIRRYAFAEFRFALAFVVDGVTSAIQLAILWTLWNSKSLDAVSAHETIGIACVLAILTVFLIWRPVCRFRRDSIISTAKRHWRFGRWILLSQLAGTANGFQTHWLIAWLVGIAEAGVFAACMTLVLITNPFIIGVGNILTPHYTRMVARRGVSAVRKPVMVTSFLLCGLLLCITCIVFAFGDLLLGKMFGSEFGHYGDLATVIGLGLTIRSLGVAPENGLRAVEASASTFASRVLALVLTFVGSVVLIPRYGIYGAAWAMLGGFLAGNILRWSLFWKYTRETVPIATEPNY